MEEVVILVLDNPETSLLKQGIGGDLRLDSDVLSHVIEVADASHASETDLMIDHNEIKCKKCNLVFQTPQTLGNHIRSSCRFISQKNIGGKMSSTMVSDTSLAENDVSHVKSDVALIDVPHSEDTESLGDYTDFVTLESDSDCNETSWYLDCVEPPTEGDQDTLSHPQVYQHPWVCFCGKSFTSKHILVFHQKVKHEKETCPVCLKEFTFAADFVKHTKNCGLPDEDKGINSNISKKKRWDPNMNLRNGWARTCPVCSKTYLTWYGLDSHLEARHRIRNLTKEPIDCGRCDRKLATFVGYIDHHLRVHKHTVTKAEIKAANDKIQLMFANSDQAQTIDSILKCEECEMAFKSRKCLKVHVYQKHRPHQEVVKECRLCGQTFAGTRPYVRHLWQEHGGEGARTYPCRTCDKVFRIPGSRWAHEQIHGHEPYHCDICDSWIKRRNDFNVHLKKHGLPKLPDPRTIETDDE